MKLKAILLSEQNQVQYSEFLLNSEHTLLYASFNYKNLIEKHLSCKSFYTLALDENNNIIGAFPLMILYTSYGNIANSLPFYGSNGGMIVKKELLEEERNHIRSFLLNEVNHIIEKEKCIVSTFITNPLDEEGKKWFDSNCKFDYLDDRIGQITHLPPYQENYDQVLLDTFEDPRPRNIRRALKEDIHVYSSNQIADLEFLYSVHKENIESIGGKAKELSFFLSIPDSMDKEDFKIYIAEKGGKKIAGLLLFYFNKTVEYYTPATIHEYRNMQPSSLLIYQAMKDAASLGFKNWNWGGTWRTQNGVYDFKKKWGAKDYPYYYFISIFDKNFLKLSKDQLLRRYPNFFVLPFHKLIPQ